MIICRRQRRMIERFSHLYFCQSLYTLQCGLPAIAGLLAIFLTSAL